MTGRDAVNYILINGYDNKPLVVYIDGKAVQVWDIDYEISRKELVILPDYRDSDIDGQVQKKWMIGC